MLFKIIGSDGSEKVKFDQIQSNVREISSKLEISTSQTKEVVGTPEIFF